MKKMVYVGVALAVGVLGAWVALRKGESASVEPPQAERTAKTGRPPSARPVKLPVAKGVSSAAEEVETPEKERPLSPEEAKEEEANRLVGAFDELTDKWMEPCDKGVTMEDVAKFCEQFRKVPKDRQDECIHRALNLVPDDNVMLLVGVLMDGGIDKEVREAVFNDVLNRDDAVKKPILLRVYNDRTHPCRENAAWLLDAIGETPKEK